MAGKGWLAAFLASSFAVAASGSLMVTTAGGSAPFTGLLPGGAKVGKGVDVLVCGKRAEEVRGSAEVAGPSKRLGKMGAGTAGLAPWAARQTCIYENKEGICCLLTLLP